MLQIYIYMTLCNTLPIISCIQPLAEHAWVAGKDLLRAQLSLDNMALHCIIKGQC